jgi:hypothetical protein
MNNHNRERLLEFAEEGIISWQDVAMMSLKFMSDAEIGEMIQMNELDLEDEDE